MLGCEMKYVFGILSGCVLYKSLIQLPDGYWRSVRRVFRSRSRTLTQVTLWDRTWLQLHIIIGIQGPDGTGSYVATPIMFTIKSELTVLFHTRQENTRRMQAFCSCLALHMACWSDKQWTNSQGPFPISSANAML